MSTPPPRVQFRLSSLLVVMAFVAMLLGWWQDHSHLQARIDRLHADTRRTAIEGYREAAARLKADAERHGGRVHSDQSTWMRIDLTGRPVSDQDLKSMQADMKRLDSWRLPARRTLGIFETEVTPAYAEQLARDVNWDVIRDRPLSKRDFPRVSY